jgi:rubrerythrin
MERSGEEFYTHLANHAGTEIVAGLCRTLAEEESRHAEMFQTTRDRLDIDTPERLWSAEEYRYLNALVDTMVLNNSSAGLQRVAGGDVRALLDLAIRIEKDTILFYAELHTLAADENVETISAIIREEKQHLRTLTEARTDAG